MNACYEYGATALPDGPSDSARDANLPNTKPNLTGSNPEPS